MPEIAVVGAGVMGLATAHALVREGRDVVVYEQFEPGHARGSSHGRTRIFRLAYAEPEWVRLAQESLALWRELEQVAGEPLLQLDGLLELVEDLGESSADALEACGVAWEELDAAAVERRFGVDVPDGCLAVLQPDAGVVRADRSLAALADGVDVRYGTRVDSTDDVDADVVVVTAGAWVNELLAEPLPVRVTRETVCYFRLAERERPLPAVVSLREGRHSHHLFALPDPVHGVKAGAHHAGAPADPNDAGEPDPQLVARVAEWVDERLELADPEPVAAETCLYTTTPDETFVLERRGRVVVGSACSGHGFKFAPAIGERLAWLATQG